jgi:NitT/TauT family transport system permease protein
MVRSLAPARWRVFIYVEARYLLSGLVVGLRTAWPLSIIGAILGEFVASDRGMGFLILDTLPRLKLDVTFGAVIVIAIVSVLGQLFIDLVSKRLGVPSENLATPV